MDMFNVLRRYKYSIGFLFSVVLGIWLFSANIFGVMIAHLDGGGYAAAFIAGFLFPITFTAAGAGLFLVELGSHYPPLIIALIGGTGAMCADLLMYRLIKGNIIDELKALVRIIIPVHHLENMERFTKKRVFLWGVPFLASLFIASPIPDEIGVALYGVANFKPKYLSLITFVLNAIGIFILVLIGFAIQV